MRVTVLVRPEQLDLQPLEWPQLAAPSPAAGGLAGQVIACEYYGHDAVVRVRPQAGPDGIAGPEVIVRTAGGPQLPPGALVMIRARGPVLAWAR